MTKSLQDLDNMVKYLSQQLKEKKLLNYTDIIILSDHGMDTYHFNDYSVDGEIIDLNRVVGKENCEMYGSSPVLQVIAKDAKNQTKICNQLKAGASKNGHYKVYTDNELKHDWHIRNGRRFGPCTVVAKPGYVFQDQTEILQRFTVYEKRERNIFLSQISRKKYQLIRDILI